MKKSMPSSVAASALEVLGVTKVEESVYRALLQHGGGTAIELSGHLGQSLRNTQRLLISLEKKGMATHSPQQVRRYFAAPPDIVIEALATRRQNDVDNELRTARLAFVELRELARATEDAGQADERVVEILSREAAAQVYAQIVRSAKDEIICLERLPILVSPTDRPDENQLQTMERGVRVRAVTDGNLFSMPGTLDRIRSATAAGERYRIYPSLPFKLVVADHRVGLMPLNVARPDGPALLLRSSSLLDALCEMFEMLWRAAVPFSASVASDAQGLNSAPLEASDALLPLLAAGLHDKAIEHELDVSHRTLTRRVSELMKNMRATTRFQLGWLAAHAELQRKGAASGVGD